MPARVLDYCSWHFPASFEDLSQNLNRWRNPRDTGLERVLNRLSKLLSECKAWGLKREFVYQFARLVELPEREWKLEMCYLYSPYNPIILIYSLIFPNILFIPIHRATATVIMLCFPRHKPKSKIFNFKLAPAQSRSVPVLGSWCAFGNGVHQQRNQAKSQQQGGIKNVAHIACGPWTGARGYWRAQIARRRQTLLTVGLHVNSNNSQSKNFEGSSWDPNENPTGQHQRSGFGNLT
ncbi:hypothetical protein FA15DRAFT_694579 [Coprinopsis marcescibilis]|uniref:Uncharacterized protein n=1 Tax=Coprinopsis marcescibilis TaxID=230819 RepID=A0A5C3KVK7_COPMA|nr:hypothetical protein FA15DRAFT_694579 [Coprinopsis marcescibilis]